VSDTITVSINGRDVVFERIPTHPASDNASLYRAYLNGETCIAFDTSDGSWTAKACGKQLSEGRGDWVSSAGEALSKLHDEAQKKDWGSVLRELERLTGGAV
jgi:hypothetical protein